MNNIDPDTLFNIVFAVCFVPVTWWMIAIMKRNPTSRVPYVVLPATTGIFAFASWLLFDNAFEKVVMLPLMMIAVVWMFKGAFKAASKERAARNNTVA